MKVKKLLGSILAVAMLTGAMAGCASSDNSSSTQSSADSGDLKEFKMTYVTWVGCAPLFIAQEKGFFEKYGIKPELILNEDESQGASLIYNNSIQAASCVMDKVVLNYANGTGQKVALIFDESTGGDGIIASQDIQTVEDLKGKKVGIDKASTEYFFLNAVLKDHNMSMDDLNIIDMDASSAGTSFISGELDAAVVWEPWLTNASQREGGHVLLSSKDYPRVIMDSLTVSKTFAEESPECVEALKNAWCDAIDYYRENPDESIEIMAEGLDLTVDDMKEMLPGVTFMGREENEEFFNKDSENNIYDVAQDMADFWAEIGSISPGLDLSGLFFE